jgi:hypothetical protein
MNRSLNTEKRRHSKFAHTTCAPFGRVSHDRIYPEGVTNRSARRVS